MMNKIREFFEKRGFEVCARLGEKVGIPASRIRLFFIYASFLTLGSPLLVYLALAFVIKLRDDARYRRRSVLDL